MTERRAPVQRFPGGIPWSMHLRAYEAYSNKYSPQQALIEGGCCGGFGTGELDMFIPGWRDELNGRTAMREALDAFRAGTGDSASLADAVEAFFKLDEK